ncbi:hypothetical protein C2E23DRAFT_889946 [Lenzites betulinus]|nr:hypothetical protein C2E23DRAFT_889946 [Lenzites betulinus]
MTVSTSPTPPSSPKPSHPASNKKRTQTKGARQVGHAINAATETAQANPSSLRITIPPHKSRPCLPSTQSKSPTPSAPARGPRAWPSPEPLYGTQIVPELPPRNPDMDGPSGATVMQELDNDLYDFTKADDTDPIECPNMGCFDQIPPLPGPQLQRLLKNRRRILLKGKLCPQSADIIVLNSAICKAIDYEVELLPEARDLGWPIAFDGKVLAARVRLLKTTLEHAVRRPKSTFIWSLLDARPGEGTLNQIAKTFECNPAAASLQDVFEAFRGGYYGEQGEVIVSSTLDVLFPEWEL